LELAPLLSFLGLTTLSLTLVELAGILNLAKIKTNFALNKTNAEFATE
jgi:hypothetical protein